MKIGWKNAPVYLLALSILLIGGMHQGCAGGMGGSVKDQLQRSTMMYFDGIRWKRFSQSALFIPVEERIQFVQKREKARDNFFVTDCEIKGLIYDSDSETAIVEVQYKWYKLPSMTIRTTRLQQKWEYKDGWLISEQEEVQKPDPRQPEGEPTDLL